MLTKQDLIMSLTQETNIIKHLASKITTAEQLAYKPSETQRTLEELLQYMSRMTHTMGTMLKAKASTPEESKKFNEASQAMNALTEFGAAMDAQLAFAIEFINGLTEEDLNTEVDLFGTGNAMPIRGYFVNIFLKNYPAYRMQLFNYLKAGLGMSELNTMNVWMGVDAPMPG